MVNRMEKESKKKSFRSRIRWFVQKQESSIVLATLVYVLFVTCVNPTFLSGDNIFNVLRTTGFTLIAVVGMSLVLITGGLDLSVGSVLALGGVATGMFCQRGVPVLPAIILGVLVGSVIGAINGFIIVKAGIPPLIVTLGMQYAARGLVSVLTQGVPIYPLPEGLMKIEQTRILNIPMVVIVAVVIAVIGHVMLSRSPFGRAIYALGGNEEAAKISGINTKRTKFMAYVITSTLAALAGVFMAARLGSAEAAAGSGYELTVICGAIIGGISTFGGMGSIIGATIGALFMEILTNSLTLMRVSVYWQNLVVGVILVLAVLLDQYKRQLILRNSIKARD